MGKCLSLKDKLVLSRSHAPCVGIRNGAPAPSVGVGYGSREIRDAGASGLAPTQGAWELENYSPNPPPPGVSTTNTSPSCTSTVATAANTSRLPFTRST